jgi:galactokinase
VSESRSDMPLDDEGDLRTALQERGLSPNAAQQKASLLARAARALVERSGAAPEDVSALFVPGRIEVLGKHTDYAGGSSMLAAAERGFCLAVRRRDDAEIRIHDLVLGESVCFRLDPELTPRAWHWSNYPMTVARRIARNFPAARRGVDVALASDLPPAAGMSSSSAFVVAMFLGLTEVNGLPADPLYQKVLTRPTDLAGYLGTIENGQSFGPLAGDRGVGTFGGSEDHTAILLARPGHVVQYAYCPVRSEREIALPADMTFAIAACGVVAEKTGDAREKYNRASRLISTILDLWRRETGRDDASLAAALGAEPHATERLKDLLRSARSDAFDPSALTTRLEHFLTENQEILPAAGDALARGDLAEFGRLVDRSQQAAERLLGNQIPETAHLAGSARRLGAAAASAFGAGFGGGVWALVDGGQADRLLSQWKSDYVRTFPQHAAGASFFLTGAGPAAFRLGGGGAGCSSGRSEP